MNLFRKASRFEYMGSHTPAMMALVPCRAASAYAVPRLPAPMTMIRGGFLNLWKSGARKNVVSMGSAMLYGSNAGDFGNEMRLLNQQEQDRGYSDEVGEAARDQCSIGCRIWGGTISDTRVILSLD